MIAAWKATPQEVAKKMLAKYGQPQEVTANRLIWPDNGRARNRSKVRIRTGEGRDVGVMEDGRKLLAEDLTVAERTREVWFQRIDVEHRLVHIKDKNTSAPCGTLAAALRSSAGRERRKRGAGKRCGDKRTT